MSIYLQIDQVGHLLRVNNQEFHTPAKVDVTNLNVSLLKRQLASQGINGYYFVKEGNNDQKVSRNLSNSSVLNDLISQIKVLQTSIQNLTKNKDLVNNDLKSSSVDTNSDEEQFIPSINVGKLNNKIKTDTCSVGRTNKNEVFELSKKVCKIAKTKK